ncbi:MULTISPECIES: gliding motility protein GldB-related protein [Chitinophagaceae]
MRTTLLAFAILFSDIAFSQSKLTVYDIAQKQLALMDKYKNSDSISRSKVFVDSLYNPYKKFWNGYLGNENDVVEWLNTSLPKLPEWLQKNKSIDGTELLRQFREVAQKMKKITGYEPRGSWYMVYGPAWTDLGGLGDFAMLIDLAHESNSSNERIVRLFPHELTHQIMTNVNPHKDTTAISSIMGEGFAVWMNRKYWGDKFTLAENLGYTEEELKLCDKNIDALKKFFTANKYSTDENMIAVFRNRNEKLNDQLPGAIGYYLGYRIVEAYIAKHGKNSWKDIFIKSPKEIYETSGFVE